MKKHYLSAKKLSLWMRLSKKWNSLYSRVQSSTDLKSVKKLNSLSLLLGVKRKIALTALAGVVTLGANAQVEFEQAGFGVNQRIPHLGLNGKAKPVFADLDDDGDKDLIVVGSDYYSSIKLFFNENNYFEEQVGENNPFSHINGFWWAAPALADVDGDGDFDLLVGSSNGDITYYENNDFVFTEQSNNDNPFNGIDVGRYSNPVMGDLDDDGDLDLLIGEVGGTVDYFQNNNGVFEEQTGSDNPFDETIDYGSRAIPTIIDLDNDSDLDVVIGDYSGDIYFIENTTDSSFVRRTGDDNPFEQIKGSFGTAPTFIDLDNDGDLDLVNGTRDAVLEYFENSNQVFIENETDVNLFDTVIDIGYNAAPKFEDINNDQVLDLIVGAGNGTINYFLKQNDEFVEQLGTDNPFNGIDVGHNANPTFFDLDEDNDLDLLVGTGDGTINYFLNENNSFTEQTGTDNPFDGIDVGTSAYLSFVDLDKDGDEDLIIGAYSGSISYYENNDNNFEVQPDSINPFSDISQRYSSFAFADVDEDGDQDLLLGRYYGGDISYYSNEDNVFTAQSGSDNPFHEVNVSYSSAPTFADLDEDGDLDLFVGSSSGSIAEYKNLKNTPTGLFSLSKNETLNIFPNPASSVINTEKGSLVIVDLTGNVILNTESNGQIDVSSLKSGVYIVTQNGKKGKIIID